MSPLFLLISLVLIHYRVPRPSWQASYRCRTVLRKAVDLFLWLREVGGGARAGPDGLLRIPTLCDETMLLSLDGKGAVWLGLPTRPLPPRESLCKTAEGRPGTAQTFHPESSEHSTEQRPTFHDGRPAAHPSNSSSPFFPANRTPVLWVAIRPATRNES